MTTLLDIENSHITNELQDNLNELGLASIDITSIETLEAFISFMDDQMEATVYYLVVTDTNREYLQKAYDLMSLNKKLMNGNSCWFYNDKAVTSSNTNISKKNLLYLINE